MTVSILLVDDESDLREAVGDLLQMEGFTVITASDGLAALQQLEVSPVDLIVADIGMPGLDGWGLVQRVRAEARWHDVPFIFLTARGRPGDARLGRELGADDYLAKPFDPEDLLTLVRSRLRRRGEMVGGLRDEVARLSEVARLKDELLALTTHEMSRPLTAIRGFSELLLRSAGDERQREFLELIRSESVALGRLADDLVQLGALERGEPLEREATDVTLVVREALRPYHVPPMSHRFQMLVAADLPAVQVDPALLRLAIANLIGNAVKYAPKRSPVRVHAFRQGDRLCLQVADEGIGIAAEDVRRLGEPFFRVRSEATRGIKGTGLGLALVWRIAKAHGGDVQVESQPGQGTAFTLRLPLP